MPTHARVHVAADDWQTVAKQYSNRSRRADARSFMELYIRSCIDSLPGLGGNVPGLPWQGLGISTLDTAVVGVAPVPVSATCAGQGGSDGMGAHGDP